MKLYINRKPDDKNSSGIFLSRIIPCLEQIGTKCSFDLKYPCHVCLACIQLNRLPASRDVKIVQRLDGIYVNTDANFRASNRPIQGTYAASHGVIFQSKLCRDIVFKYFGKPRRKSCVIHNGTIIVPQAPDFVVNKYPKHARILDYQTRIFCSAQWRNTKRIPSILHGFDCFNKDNPNSCLVIAGHLSPEEDRAIKEINSNIITLGRIPSKHICQFQYICNVFMNLSFLDACPNSVVEALAYGVPCVVTKFQGVAEMMSQQDGVVIDVDKWDFSPISFNKQVKQIDKHIVSKAISTCVEIGRRPIRQELDISCTAQKYNDFFKECLT